VRASPMAFFKKAAELHENGGRCGCIFRYVEEFYWAIIKCQ
jgi:hypothetical protein